MSSPVSRAELASAKINLALHVTGQRADGYHLLDSLVVFTRFGDRLELHPSDSDSLRLVGPYAAGLPEDDSNLVCKARDALRAACPHAPTPPVTIRLEKNLPVASGIGGGSSDAAAVLRGLRDFWALDITPDALLAIGKTLGADVPMCLTGKPLIAKGTGDQISVVADFPEFALVLVNPGVAVATPDVFAALTARDNEPLPPLPAQLDFDALIQWLHMTRNDLEAAAETIEPGITAAKSALSQSGAEFARMSGSGATCFGLFRTGNIAKRAAISIRQEHPDWFVATTRTMPLEQVDGQD